MWAAGPAEAKLESDAAVNAGRQEKQFGLNDWIKQGSSTTQAVSLLQMPKLPLGQHHDLSTEWEGIDSSQASPLNMRMVEKGGSR